MMGRKGEGEKGRRGEGEKGRMGEGEKGRMGEWEKGRLREYKALSCRGTVKTEYNTLLFICRN
jgi:hypothetical protein